jgi:steroid delta-isomerase-like uncharacterized protein
MTIEQNIAVSRRMTEAINANDADALRAVLAPGFTAHLATTPPMGLDGYIQFNLAVRTAIPDFQFVIEDVVAQDDKVVFRMTASGTQQGTFLGIPASGKRFAITGMVLRRIAEGRVIEEWGNPDQLGMFQQLGAFPRPPGA